MSEKELWPEWWEGGTSCDFAGPNIDLMSTLLVREFIKKWWTYKVYMDLFGVIDVVECKVVAIDKTKDVYVLQPTDKYSDMYLLADNKAHMDTDWWAMLHGDISKDKHWRIIFKPDDVVYDFYIDKRAFYRVQMMELDTVLHAPSLQTLKQRAWCDEKVLDISLSIPWQVVQWVLFDMSASGLAVILPLDEYNQRLKDAQELSFRFGPSKTKLKTSKVREQSYPEQWYVKLALKFEDLNTRQQDTIQNFLHNMSRKLMWLYKNVQLPNKPL